MSLDGLAIKKLAFELKEKLLGGKIDKLAQPNSQTLTFQVRVNNENKRMLASINPQNARLVITNERFENPPAPPLFVMVMRKHLQNAQIADIRQIDNERMIEFLLDGRNEVGEKTSFSLVFELMGKNSNIILRTPDDVILDAIRKVGINTNAYRQIQPGLSYIMPPSQEKLDPFTLDEETLEKHLLSLQPTWTLKKALLATLAGFGPQSILELICRAGLKDDERIEFLGQGDYRAIYLALEKLKADFFENAWQAEWVMEDDTPFAFAPFTLTQYASYKKEIFDDLSTLLERYYHTKEVKERFKQRQDAIKRIIRHEIERCEKKYALQLETIDKKDQFEPYRIYGELLTANLWRIDKKASEVILENFYDDNKPITIPLNTELTPNDNAQSYFKRYNRAKKGAEQASLHAKATEEELNYLATILDNLLMAEKNEELSQIREELAQSGYVKKESAKKKKKEDTLTLTPYEYQSYDIFVGKNNLQNDYLTL